MHPHLHTKDNRGTEICLTLYRPSSDDPRLRGSHECSRRMSCSRISLEGRWHVQQPETGCEQVLEGGKIGQDGIESGRGQGEEAEDEGYVG